MSISALNQANTNVLTWGSSNGEVLNDPPNTGISDPLKIEEQGAILQFTPQNSPSALGPVNNLYTGQGTLASAAVGASSPTAAPVQINGQDAYVRDGVTYIWSRKLAEALGVSASWDESKWTVNIGGYDFAPAEVEDGKSYVKLHDVTDKLGYEVDWDAGSSQAVISKASYVTQNTTQNLITFNPSLVADSYLKNNSTYLSADKLAGLLQRSYSLNSNGTVTIGGKSFVVDSTLNGHAYVKATDVVNNFSSAGYGIAWNAGTVSITNTSTKPVTTTTQVAAIRTNVDSDCYVDNGSTYIWSSKLAQALGTTVSWNSSTSQVTIGGKVFNPVKVVNGKSFVKLTDVTNALGYQTQWDDPSKSVIISKTTTTNQQVTNTLAIFTPHEIGDSYQTNNVTYAAAEKVANALQVSYSESNGNVVIAGKTVAASGQYNGQTFVKLQDVTDALGLDLNLDRSRGTASVTKTVSQQVKVLTEIASVKPQDRDLIQIGKEDAFIKDGVTYMWSQKLATALGATASWDPAKCTVTIAGNEFMPADVIDGKSYVKVRDVTDKLGYDLSWDDASGESVISKPVFESKVTTQNITTFKPNEVADSYLKNNSTYLSADKLAGLLQQSYSLKSNGTVTIGGKSFAVDSTLNGHAYVKATDVVNSFSGAGYGIAWNAGTVSITNTSTKPVTTTTQVATIRTDVDSDCYVDNGTTYIWSSKLAQALGTTATWNLSTSQVTIGGKVFNPVKVVNGKSFVKLTDVTNALGYQTQWDDPNKSVIISKATTTNQQVTDTLATFNPHEIGDSYLTDNVTYASAKKIADALQVSYSVSNGNVVIDGKTVAASGQYNMQTFVKLRDVTDALGLSLNWDGNTGTATVAKTDIAPVQASMEIARVEPQDRDAVKIGEEDAYLKEGFTYIGAQKLADALGLTETWDASRQTVSMGGYTFTPDQVDNGKPYLKLRDVADKLNLITAWNADTGEVSISKMMGDYTPVTNDVLTTKPNEVEDAYLQNDTTYVSAVKLAGMLNASCSGHPSNGVINIGGKYFGVASTINGQAFVKASDVANALGYKIDWNGDTGTVTLSHTVTKPVATKQTVATIHPDGGDAYIQDGTTYMWSSNLGQLLGASVSWDAKNGKVIINGHAFTPSKVVDGKSYVKVTDVAQTLGYNADWDNQTQSVIISKTVMQNQPVTEQVGTFHPQAMGDSFVADKSTYMSAAKLADALHVSYHAGMTSVQIAGKTFAVSSTVNGQAYVKLHDVADALGYGVTWDDSTETATLTKTTLAATATELAKVQPQVIGVTPDGDADQKRNAVKQLAEKWLGKLEYTWGGSDLDLTKPVGAGVNGGFSHGLDCSGFVRSVYNSLGILGTKLEGSSFDLYDNYGTNVDARGADGSVDWSKLKVGDLIYIDNEGSGTANHVAIYVGNGTIIHENGGEGPEQYVNEKSLTNDGSDTKSYYKEHIVGIKRLITDSSSSVTPTAPGQMQPSDALVNFTAAYEDFSPTAYQGVDSQNFTIGYGHVIQPGENFDNGITIEQGKALLKKDMQKAANDVNNLTSDLHLSQQQFDALVDFAYNCGGTALGSSTLLKDVKAGASLDTLRVDFDMFVYSNGVKYGGLWRRREDEWEMYAKGNYNKDDRPIPPGYK